MLSDMFFKFLEGFRIFGLHLLQTLGVFLGPFEVGPVFALVGDGCFAGECVTFAPNDSFAGIASKVDLAVS